MMWKKGDEVYYKKGDFMGIVVSDECGGKVMVKFNLPYDPALPPKEISEMELEDAETVRNRYR